MECFVKYIVKILIGFVRCCYVVKEYEKVAILYQSMTIRTYIDCAYTAQAYIYYEGNTDDRQTQ